MAYMPIGCISESVIAEFITAAINRWPGYYEFAPAFIEIEKSVVRWLCEMMGMPEGSSGILTSGGSLANFAAVHTARVIKLPENFSSGVLYASDQTHHSITRAARLAGFPKANVRTVPTDSACRIEIEALRKMIRTDRTNGLMPFLLVANAGTINTGAVDDLEALSKVCAEENMWFHIDAAWAGTFRLTDHGKKLMRGTENADSITIDPHKALYIPFGTGALLVKDVRTLKKAHTTDAVYLPDDQEDLEIINPSHISPELSRNLRGLQTWLPIKVHGITPFKNNMEEKLQLTLWATEQLRKIPRLSIVTEPQLAIVTFTYDGKNIPQDKTDEINKAIIAKVNSDGRVLISGTTIKNRFVIRLVPFGLRTHKPSVQLALDLLRKAFEGIESNG